MNDDKKKGYQPGKYYKICACVIIGVTFCVIAANAYRALKYSDQFVIGASTFMMIGLQFLQLLHLKGRLKSILVMVCACTWVVFGFIALSYSSPKSHKTEESKEIVKLTKAFSFTLQIQSLGEPVTVKKMERVKLIFEKRLKKLGYSKSIILIQPVENRIEVQIPDANEAEAVKIRAKITEVAAFQLFKVARVISKNSEYYDSTKVEGERWDLELMKEDIVGQKVFPVVRFDEEGNKTIENYVITTETKPFLDGTHVKYAFPSRQTGAGISIELTSDGAKINRNFTRTQMVQGEDAIALVFDSECVTVATQQAKELGGKFVISGMKDLEDSKRIAESASLSKFRFTEL